MCRGVWSDQQAAHTTKVSSGGSGGTPLKFCTSKNFMLYGMVCVEDKAIQEHLVVETREIYCVSALVRGFTAQR